VSLPYLFGVAPFGLVTGVAMPAGGIPPAQVSRSELALQKGVLPLAKRPTVRRARGDLGVVAWRWRPSFATIGAGLLALHLFDWLT
jgi:hypothetical protein